MSKCMGCMKEKGESEACPHCGYVSPKEQENAAYLPEGTVLQNRYLLGRVLGQGGFGITYIGYDNTLDARVAIKEYYPGDIAQRTPGDKTVTPYTQASADYEHGKKRFIEEARTLARFSDFPGIVSVKDCFEEDNTAYMVMQFLEGIDLKEYLKRKGGKISPEEAVSILTPVMDALKEIHRAGIIHRDISPDNIFITTEGQIKLIDFGAARQSLGGGKSLSIQLKPGYAPEEQYRTHGNQGPWTDVYALAATLYRMVTGQVPPEAMERMSYDTLEIPQELPENIRTALQIGLAVRAPERYASVEQFQSALAGKTVAAPVNLGKTPGGNLGGAGTAPRPSGGQAYGSYAGGQRQGSSKEGGAVNKALIALISVCSVVAVAAVVAIAIMVVPRLVEPETVAVSTAAPTAEPTPIPTPAVVELPDLYNPGLTYNRMNGIGSATLVTSREEYDKICNTIRGFSEGYSNFVKADMGNKSIDLYNSNMSPYVKIDSRAYTNQWNYYNKWDIASYTLNEVTIDSASKNGDAVFAWVYEQQEEIKNGVAVSNQAYWVYRLEASGDGYLVTDYISDPDRR